LSLGMHACVHPGCGWRASKLSTLQAHVAGKHGTERPFACSVCAKDFRWARALHLHFARFHAPGGRDDDAPAAPPPPLTCSFPGCGWRACSATTLAAHVTGKHEKAKSFRCAQCERSFSWQRSLREHVALTHGDGGKVTFACAVEGCPHLATTKSNLTMHVKVKHSLDRPWVCAAVGCGYAAVSKYALQRHQAAKGHPQ
jgi:KRAB domain-containing zinc finger protein